jgi:hypothetical protein
VLVEWTMEEATVALAEVERVVAKGGGAPWFPTPSPDSAPQRLNLPNPVPESVLIPRFIGLLLRFRVLSISSNSWGAVVDEFSRDSLAPAVLIHFVVYGAASSIF